MVNTPERVRKNVYLGGKADDLIHPSSVRTLAVLENHLAHGHLLELVRASLMNESFGMFGSYLPQAGQRIAICSPPHLLVVGKYGFLHAFRSDEVNVFIHLLRNLELDIIMLRLSAFSSDLVNELIMVLLIFMSGIYCPIITSSGTSFAPASIMMTFPRGSTVRQDRIFPLFRSGIENKLPVNQPHHCCANGPSNGMSDMHGSTNQSWPSARASVMVRKEPVSAVTSFL